MATRIERKKRLTNHLRRLAIVASLLLINVNHDETVRVYAAEFQDRTGVAYDEYVKHVTQAFLARAKGDNRIEAASDESISVRPGRQDGIIDVPGGLVHHWIANAYIRGVSLKRAVEVSSAYGEYDHVYQAVIRSTVLRRHGDSYGVLVRVKEREAGISAVLDIQSSVQYTFPSERVAYAISKADLVREVKNAGEPGEQLLPPGQDSGYLWRANTFTMFKSDGGGVRVETETVALSRSFPPMLGWAIEPIALRVGRRSAERSLREFVAAVRGTTVAQGLVSD